MNAVVPEIYLHNTNHSINSFLILSGLSKKGPLAVMFYEGKKEQLFIFVTALIWEGFRAVEEFLLLCDSGVPVFRMPCISTTD